MVDLESWVRWWCGFELVGFSVGGMVAMFFFFFFLLLLLLLLWPVLGAKGC